MSNAKTFIAYLLVAIFLLGSIAASAQTTKPPISDTVESDFVGVAVGIVGGR